MVLDMLQKAKKAQNSIGIATIAFEAAANGGSKVSSSGQDSEEGSSNVKLDQTEDPILSESRNLSFEEFCRDRKFLKLEAETKELLDTMLVKLQKQVDLLTTGRGILRPTEKMYVKLVKAFLEAGKTKELAEFLIKAEKEDSPISVDDSPFVHIINSCISLGRLDQPHDLLDEMRLTMVATN